MPRVRIHQHVNPLAPYYRQAPRPVDVNTVFSNPTQPLHLDIGSARGRFILRLAIVRPEWNFLGVEIREPLVDEANRIAAENDLSNLHYAFCNAMLSLDELLEELPFGCLRAVSIQFPDPWFKKKHAKRRMVNVEMIQTIAKILAPGGQVFVQTDIEFLADEMFRLFNAEPSLEEVMIEGEPFPIKTEREKAVELKGLPIYRKMWRKNED